MKEGENFEELIKVVEPQEVYKEPGQSHKHSFIEACSNTAIGYTISMITWYCILWSGQYDINTTLTENLVIQGIFTVVSIARGYTLRRIFNART